jgi:hypothetical protein
MELVTGVFAILIQKASCESAGVESQPVCKGPFPDPEQQAEALLEICPGDVDEAQGIAATNLKFARSWDDGVYWLRVEGLIEASAGRDFGKRDNGKPKTGRHGSRG